MKPAPLTTAMPDASPAAGGGSLPALLALVVAIVGWLLGSDWRAAVEPLQQQLQSASRLAGRSTDSGLDAVRRNAAAMAAQRTSLEARLRSSDSEQLVRARIVQTLRERCADSLATQCLVKLSEDAAQARPLASAASPAPAAGRDSAPASLEQLGIRRARAVVSGGFANDEPLRIVQALQDDPQQVWRLNGVTVRGNTFEIDVELHTRGASGSAQR